MASLSFGTLTHLRVSVRHARYSRGSDKLIRGRTLSLLIEGRSEPRKVNPRGHAKRSEGDAANQYGSYGSGILIL